MSESWSPGTRGAFVTEVYSAIQGEAALVGERQIFVRLAGCNIRCAYCDQPASLDKAPGPCRVEHSPGRRDWRTVASPVTPGALVASVARLWEALPHHSVSVTGGEPLVQASALAEILPLLADHGMPIQLETNGILGSALARLLPWLTYVSMDVKLDSVDGQEVALDRHARFLAAAVAAGRRVWVKVVVGAATSAEEVTTAARMVDDIDPGVELFLQPVTPFGAVVATPSPDQVLSFQDAALQVHRRVRVVPQTHRQIDQL